MRLLLDTQIAIWAVSADRRLSRSLSNPIRVTLVSLVSAQIAE
jgi:PIN domain nuclease of toxin-antitoxin system